MGLLPCGVNLGLVLPCLSYFRTHRVGKQGAHQIIKYLLEKACLGKTTCYNEGRQVRDAERRSHAMLDLLINVLLLITILAGCTAVARLCK